ncbi:sugar O-acetyltransferase [Staphylococcus simiae]|uniref:sugar O-acetyltransferase n=1 Tax=Staphylococcus simiae TaxID=308354 RepID=UPI001A965719|nr:sugar O-acetyltransferase [Staphylococcus simiae]MBO1198175.1 sugar O-acetyltransferase [Staphylococcus simiae]MBO1200281.1 sugar O-acetyltransferase [Staphylococcus simiae]MBO1202555.1 sugar O-acetyltransferase [Staphylococcus simiae]MBO1210167.1 sugar O-acetyltransferase [Staphylococcus simiae]MBO1228699.1 sugar O-acetyltransferase [Staphylococcus simiae]
MSEKEKMLAHQWYDANFDQELIADRQRAKELCFDLNHTRPSNNEQRKQLIDELFQSKTNNVDIAIPFDTDYGWNVTLGKNVFVNTNCYFMDGGSITIGDNVFIGPNCGFYTATHPLDFKRRNEGLELAEPIVIGSNTWFGGHVAVMPGVTIGQGSVIGASSVVTKDIPPNSLAVGNPCRVIKQIDNEA